MGDGPHAMMRDHASLRDNNLPRSERPEFQFRQHTRNHGRRSLRRHVRKRHLWRPRRMSHVCVVGIRFVLWDPPLSQAWPLGEFTAWAIREAP